MNETTCRLDECNKPVKRMGLCYGHYMKHWRYGTTNPSHPDRFADLVGQRFGQLLVTNRVEGGWHCVCDCGSPTTVRTGDLNRGAASCGDRSHRLVAHPSYKGAHERVVRKHGRAKVQDCADCGATAAHWSYDHADPDELHTTEGYAYSASPHHYVPRCVPCHKRFDLSHVS